MGLRIKGMYFSVCTFTNLKYTNVNVCLFSVGRAPEVNQFLEDITAVAPNSVKFECRIKPGEPSAEIRWFKDAKEIYKSTRHRATYKDGLACLHISDTDSSDAGRYRCEAYNNMGRVDTSAILRVASKYLTYVKCMRIYNSKMILLYFLLFCESILNCCLT